MLSGGWRRFAFVIIAVGSAQTCLAQQLLVGNGSTLRMATGQLDLGCHDLSAQGGVELQDGSLIGANNVTAIGSLRGGNGALRLSGDFDAAAAFVAENGSVIVEDGCARTQSAIIGNHAFNQLFLHSSVGRVQILPADQVQSIASGLEMEGGTERLILHSSVPGSVARLSLAAGGVQRVNRVDVIDVGAPPEGQYLAPELPGVYDSIDRGNSPRFFSRDDQPAVPVPLLGPAGLLILMLLIASSSAQQILPLSRGN